MRVSVAGVVQVAVPFTWLGMVLAISFLETPLRFRAPGITVPVGLGIGRLVFRNLAVAELALAVALTVALVLTKGTAVVGAAPWTLTAILWVVLAIQAACSGRGLISAPASSWPGRARRAPACTSPTSRSRGIKVVLLPIVGVVLVAGIAS